MFNIFFASVFNKSDGLWDLRWHELKHCDWGNNHFRGKAELVLDLLLHLDVYKSMQPDAIQPKIFRAGR